MFRQQRSFISGSAALIVMLCALLLLPSISVAQDAPPSSLRHYEEVPRSAQIWNGADTNIEMQPWLVTVFTSQSFCGGMLVHYQWVITAAHCVDTTLPLNVLAGLSQFEFSPELQERAVVQVSSHPDYDPLNLTSDVAVLRVDSPFVPSSTVGLINLASEAIQPGPALLAGFGDVTDAGATLDQLQVGEMTIISDVVCDAIWRDYAASIGQYWPGLTTVEVCTQPSVSQAGGCSGDSGSPLVIDSVQGIPLAVGVVSWGVNCETLPTVFTNIVEVRPFIDSILPEIETCAGLWPTLVAVPGVATGGTSRGDVIWGTNGADVINARGGNDLICGRGGNDVIVGGDGNDTLYGNSGNDRLVANSGADYLVGGPGNDTQLGGPGDDRLFGGTGADLLQGDDGNDILWGFAGDDQMFGGNGDDYFAGLSGHDLMVGNEGDDQMFGGIGRDDIRGDAGNDILSGGVENDVLSGGPGNDLLIGDRGNDKLAGQAGMDTLRGLNGNDSLFGGPGADSCDGGLGADTTNASCETQIGFP